MEGKIDEELMSVYRGIVKAVAYGALRCTCPVHPQYLTDGTATAATSGWRDIPRHEPDCLIVKAREALGKE